MYRKILVALDNTPADASLLPHITELARLTGAAMVLVHVADGWVAQWHNHLNLADSEEMREDQIYLEKTAERLRGDGFVVQPRLSMGDPAREILKVARLEGCDLIAMTTHGHRFLVDVFLGSTIEKVRHETDIPILVVRAAPR